MRPPRLEGMALAAPITVRDGDPCHVTVEVAGIPIPDITWFHGSREIKNCPDFRVDDKGTSCTLYIAAVTEEMTTRGVRVVARNRVGVETKNVELKVYKVHTKWRPIVKSESFSTRSPDTFLRNKRRRRKVQSGTSVTSLNREPPPKPARSMSMAANWSYRHASHSTDSILDEVFSFDRKSAFASSTPRDVDPKHSESQEISQISPISHASPTTITQPSSKQKDVMTDSGFSENIFRYRSSETDEKHIEVGRVPPIALPEDFDIEPIISPKTEERLMSPREPKPMMYHQQQSAVLETKPPSGRPTDFRDGRRLSANGQIWISEKKISKSLSAMQNLGDESVPSNKKVMLASQEKWESQEKVKRRSTGSRLEPSPPSQQQQKMEYQTREQQVEAFLRCDEPDTAVITPNNKSANVVPNNTSTTPIIKRKTSAVPKRARPVSETNLDDFVVLAPLTKNNTSTQAPPVGDIKKEVAVKPPPPLSPLSQDESQLARLHISGINANDTAVLNSMNNMKLTQTPKLSGVGFNTEKDTSVALLGLTGKKGEQKRQSKAKDQVLTKAEILLSVEGPSFHPDSIPKDPSPECRPEELSSLDVSEQLNKATQVMAAIEAGKVNNKDAKRKVSPSSNDKAMQWVYPRSKQEGDSAVSISKSNINSNNSAKSDPSDTSHLPCVKVLDDAISYIYAEAFAHFGDTADTTLSTPLAQMAKRTSQEKDQKIVSQLLEYPYVYRSNGVLPRLSEASDEDSLASSQNIKDNFSNNNSTKSKYSPDLLNGINTNSNNRQEAHSEVDMDSVEVIGLSDDVDVRSLRDQVEPSPACTFPTEVCLPHKDLHSGGQPSRTDQHLAETATEDVNPVIDDTCDVAICANADASEHICDSDNKICDNNPDVHSIVKENSENGSETPEKAEADPLGATENDVKEEEESDDESVQTVVEVGEDQTINLTDDAELDNNLQDLAQTLVDEVLKASVEVILVEEAALGDTLDVDITAASATEPPTSPDDSQPSAATQVTFEGEEQQENSEGTGVVEASLMVKELSQSPVNVSDRIEEKEEQKEEGDSVKSHSLNQPPAENELKPEVAPTCEDVVISVVNHHALAEEPQSEVVENTTHLESTETQAEMPNKPPVVALSQEQLARVESYVAEIIKEAIAVFTKEEEAAQKIENETDESLPYEGATESVSKTDKALKENESFLEQVEAWVAGVISEAITVAANQKHTDNVVQIETAPTFSQQSDAESLTSDIPEPTTKDSHQVTDESLPSDSSEVSPYSYIQETCDIPLEQKVISPVALSTQTGSTDEGPITRTLNQDPHADIFGDDQPEGDLEHLELELRDLLQNSRNRTSSLSSISEESEEEEEVSFVDETFHLSDIPSTTYKAQEQADDKLVVDTFTQIDLPGHAGKEDKADLSQDGLGPSMLPDAARGDQGVTHEELALDADRKPVLAQTTGGNTDGLIIHRQDAPIVCATSLPLTLTPAAVSSDSEALESSITDENTLDLSWDSDMGPELSFTAADRMAYNLRMATGEVARVKRDSETNTEPAPILVHAATEVLHEAVTDNTDSGNIKTTADCGNLTTTKDSGNLKTTADCGTDQTSRVDIPVHDAPEVQPKGITHIKSATDQNGNTDLSKTTKSSTPGPNHVDTITQLNKDADAVTACAVTASAITADAVTADAVTTDAVTADAVTADADSTCSTLPPSGAVREATAAAEKLDTASSTSSTSSSPATSSSPSSEGETDDGGRSIVGSIREVLTQNQGAALFLLLAVAAMAALSWWSPSHV